MRLLRSNTLEFENFEDEDTPTYAILSHRWGREEVSFQEMREGSGRLKAGYEKIKRCGEMAAENGNEYFWADTCCIDKSSSEELSEAINSMHTWYRNASVCYAYLSDVSAASSPHPVYPTISTFWSSEWFTRGWTLQELIASSNLIFLSKEWERIGSKEDLKNTSKRSPGST
jgi:Heterokaryon incompatibility protein (HET)